MLHVYILNVDKDKIGLGASLFTTQGSPSHATDYLILFLNNIRSLLDKIKKKSTKINKLLYNYSRCTLANENPMKNIIT